MWPFGYGDLGLSNCLVKLEGTTLHEMKVGVRA
jgi:hypothetical protein